MAILFVMAQSWLDIHSAVSPEPAVNSHNNDLTVSIITCYPGPEIYELCGHAAIRVRGEGIDSVWNYGIFDFNQPGFVYRFVKGETDYKGMGYPFEWFLPEYIQRNSKVVEQDLNLSPDETQKLLGILRESAKPENATYRYNYVKDNCATRILDKLENGTDQQIRYPDTVRYASFRNEMRHYHEGYPWYQFGIDLALGSGLDRQINPRQEMFVPVELERNLSVAYFSDGTPVVKDRRVLYDGSERSVLPPTPWYFSPLFLAWVIFLIIFGIILCDFNRNKIFKPVYIFWFSLLGLAGLLVSFLVFVSVHEATSPNVLIIWLNPLQFLFVAGVIFRRLKILATALAYYNFIAVGVLLIVWPFQNQSANPAFFPLMFATVALGLEYAIIGRNSSYINGKLSPKRSGNRKSLSGSSKAALKKTKQLKKK